MLNATAELLRGRRKELLSMLGTVYVPWRKGATADAAAWSLRCLAPTLLGADAAWRPFGAYLAMRRLARFCAIAVNTLLSWLACATS